MPQAKKARFIVTGKFTDEKGEQVRAGSLIDLEVDENGTPVNGLIASRVKPFKGEVIGEQPTAIVPADVKAQVDQYIAEAEEQVKAMTEQANKEALEVLETAKAEAASILKAAGEEAERIINEATKAKK